MKVLKVESLIFLKIGLTINLQHVLYIVALFQDGKKETFKRQ